LTKNEIPIGFIEAKNIGDTDLLGKKKSGNKEQFDRYKESLSNLIFTDYLNFYVFQDGELTYEIRIAELIQVPSSNSTLFNTEISPLSENFERFENLVKDFSSHIGQTIKSSKKLAKMMAGKARLLSDIIEKSLTSDEENHEDSTLKEQMAAFKSILIHDITPKGFADVYAQTISYGMFAARLHDPTLDNFSRQEAAELIPKSNPFLRKLFGYIAGPDIDDRIRWIVDNLTEIFLACNVADILKNYGRSTKMEDPIIHFYENFLAEYDPKLRKARGVWYTPAPVVNFIVRAVDHVLKEDFDLSNGLADNSKITIKQQTQTPNKNFKSGYKEIERELHKVQVLDPATGTGTFLAEVIKHVSKKFKGQEGIWSSYVENHLLPRLNGFELLMASYAMAHLQLDLLLKETGFKPTKNQRTRVYLTNSLEEYHPDTGTLFANWLSSEANEANQIKRDAPVMCILGNPPYSGESSNKGKWIMKLMEDYKKEPGGKEKLKERNPKWINDDYVKFLRYGQHYIEKNGSGILAYINPHGFLDNPTFRGMRWNLLKTYDKIYTIDLHGNSKKKETSPDGSPDVNVFDIMQGVSINLFIKTGKKKANDLGKIYHYDLYGKREFKYDFLTQNSLSSIKFNELPNRAPNYFMVQKDFKLESTYSKHIKLNELFIESVTGFQTHRDDFATAISRKELISRIKEFANLDIEDETIKSKYNLRESKEWKINSKRKVVDIENIDENIFKCSYRPFELRYVTIDKAINDRPRTEIIKNFRNGKNLSLLAPKQQALVGFRHILVSNYIASDCTLSSKSREGNQIFPLYVYNTSISDTDQSTSSIKKPNLNSEIINTISEKLSLKFTDEKESGSDAYAPIDVLDYINAVLHSPSYREKYKEFLKIDFPRIPYPKDKTTFLKLVAFGKEIRQIHLLESKKVEEYLTSYPVEGSNEITTKIAKKDWVTLDSSKNLGRIWINDVQYFDSIPLVAWEFYIGGYQPAQKWLKDRRGSILDFNDILQYQRIIVALTETYKLMNEINKIEIE
jgi:predicted helicase